MHFHLATSGAARIFIYAYVNDVLMRANASNVRPACALTAERRQRHHKTFMAGNYAETAERGQGRHHLFVSHPAALISIILPYL